MVERIVGDLTEGALEESKPSVAVSVRRVVLHRSIVAATVEHQPVPSIIVHMVVLDGNMVAPFRCDCFSRGGIL